MKILFDYVYKIYNWLLRAETSLISDELVDIMANENDKIKYFDAIKKVRVSKCPEKVQLSSGKILVVSG